MDFVIEVVKFLTALVGFAAAMAGFAPKAQDGARKGKRKGYGSKSVSVFNKKACSIAEKNRKS